MPSPILCGSEHIFSGLLASLPTVEKWQEQLAFLLDNVTANWQRAQAQEARKPSRQNWRFNKRPHFSHKNRSQETKLERRIVRVTDQTWANQIPTSSGLVNRYGGHCNFDLAHRLARQRYELIELKVRSDTPFTASIQAIGYGLTYLFSWINREQLGYRDKDLLFATQVHLRVLAPAAYYYQDIEFSRWLAAAGSAGLVQITRARTNGHLTMDFGFLAFPKEFEPTSYSDDQLRNCLANLEPVYAN